MAKLKQPTESAHDRDRIIVRLPDGMRDDLAALAEANGRSMTSEVVAAIDKHLKGVDRITQLWEFFEQHRRQIEEIRAAVENLEIFAGRTGDFRDGLRERRLYREREASAAELTEQVDIISAAIDEASNSAEAVGPAITAEQARKIRALLNEIGASEASLLKELKVPSVESMHDLIFKRALSILEVWRREKKERPA